MASAAAATIEQYGTGVIGEGQQVVLCELAGELHGVDIARVEENIRLLEITRVPRAPHSVEGVISRRGTVSPVVDLLLVLGLHLTESTKSSRVVVVEAGDLTIGMIVDAVTEVLCVPDGSVEPPSQVVTDLDTTCLRGIAKLHGRLVRLLDLDRALYV